MDRVAFFRIILWRNKIHWDKTFSGEQEYNKTNNIRKCIRIIYNFLSSLYPNIPSESPSYEPTFFIQTKFSLENIVVTILVIYCDAEELNYDIFGFYFKFQPYFSLYFLNKTVYRSKSPRNTRNVGTITDVLTYRSRCIQFTYLLFLT